MTRIKGVRTPLISHCIIFNSERQEEYSYATNQEAHNAALLSFSFPKGWEDDEAAEPFPCVSHFRFSLKNDVAEIQQGVVLFDAHARVVMLSPADHAWILRFAATCCFTRFKLAPPTQYRDSCDAFLNALNNIPHPFPGESFDVRAQTLSTFLDGSHTFTRPMDDDQPHDVRTLFETLTTHHILLIFQALLEERRILICGHTMHHVADCILALQSLLFPFRWQHISIPILPKSLIDYIMAPMPFIIGIHDSFLEDIYRFPLDEVLLINLTTKQINLLDHTHSLKPPFKISLPDAHSFYMKIHEKLPLQQNDIFDAPSLQEIFLDYFVDIFGVYRRFITTDGAGNDDIVFLEKEFFEYNPKYTPLLTKMKESQLFEQWLRERLTLYSEGSPPSGRFELACAGRYPEDYNLVYSQHRESFSQGDVSEKEKVNGPRLKRWAQGLFSRGRSMQPVIQHHIIAKSPTLQRVQKKSNQALVTFSNKLVMGKRTYTLSPSASARLSQRRGESSSATVAKQPRDDPLAELRKSKRENALLTEEDREILRDEYVEGQFANQFLELQGQLKHQMSGVFSSSRRFPHDDDDELDLMDLSQPAEEFTLLDFGTSVDSSSSPAPAVHPVLLEFEDTTVESTTVKQDLFDDLFAEPMVSQEEKKDAIWNSNPMSGPRSLDLDDLFSTNSADPTRSKTLMDTYFDAIPTKRQMTPTPITQKPASDALLLDLDPFA